MAQTKSASSSPRQMVPPKSIDVTIDQAALAVFTHLVATSHGRTPAKLADQAYQYAEAFVNHRNHTTATRTA